MSLSQYRKLVEETKVAFAQPHCNRMNVDKMRQYCVVNEELRGVRQKRREEQLKNNTLSVFAKLARNRRGRAHWGNAWH